MRWQLYRRTAAWILAGALGCVHRPPASDGGSRPPSAAPEDDAGYPDAIGVGDRLGVLTLPLADGGRFELGAALAAGPVVLIWIGGAEHAALTTWLGALDRSLAELEQRAATLVFVRPLAAEAALRWAVELRIQTAVAGDPHGALAAWLGEVDATRASPLEFAIWIAQGDTLRYRQIGGARPAPGELLAVLDALEDPKTETPP